MKASIKDLRVNINDKLTPTSIRALEKIVNEEFENKRTMINAENEQKREDIKEQYIKGVKADKLIKELEQVNSDIGRAKDKHSKIVKALALKGINSDGGVICNWYQYSIGYTPEENRSIMKKAEEVNSLLNKVNDNDVLSLKNKIIARLHLADTKGEAIVILHEVLGNGIIPNLSTNEVKSLNLITKEN